MKRRQIIKGLASILPAAAGLSAPSVMAQAKPKLSVVGPLSMSGGFASVGTLVHAGNMLGAEYFSRTLPVTLDYTTLDDQSDPGKGVRKVVEAIQVDKVRYFSGTTNSASALAVAKEVHKAGGVYVNQAGADSMTGADCNRSTFRWPVSTYGCIEQSVRPLTKLQPKAKRWYTITGQYVFGESMLSNTKRVLAEAGCEHVGNAYHSLAEKEFSGYLASAMAARPDVVCILNFGNQTIEVIRAALSFGLNRNAIIIAPWSTGLDQFDALGADSMNGIYFGAQYWHDVKTPGNQQFLKVYGEKHKDKPPYAVASAYAAMQMIAEAVRKANSTDPQAVIKAMEGLEYDGVTGREHVRAGDHQVLRDVYLMRGKPKASMKDAADYVDIVSSGQTFLPVDKTGCSMA
ncbi:MULTISPECIES: ABC transporter substrate-binding protein [unclassified Variovorax]|uniref:ABC transporter substrate-binding protein n=1 Tax=unclassified Variovorax TaxID=663243 RepID=UPI00076BC172|nr:MULTISPECIES: ABC transporter substrate-binding protein [unclassified Variovorax]KWT97954.1 Leucine-, isoleucine-, valine-, threonine-, and alanine-binding protein [Variovorax sp. WDL1]PNG59207.1 Leucine-, isoleucine-, valine-, threonine-, and alanine-binding protein [Variovorax sp. B4]PNG61002.1 Leucine-, isoleucine-, valine-, threonine-, and alanine-binding protein [Variovorax sp. B2]VTV13060.1 Leucine-, isoleucine-, valine-, threonine-, and alanine-binding protein precursor [Variovorax sp